MKKNMAIPLQVYSLICFLLLFQPFLSIVSMIRVQYLLSIWNFKEQIFHSLIGNWFKTNLYKYHSLKLKLPGKYETESIYFPFSLELSDWFDF